MARTTVLHGSVVDVVNVDDPRVRGDLRQAIAIGQLIDELTGAPVRADVGVTTDLAESATQTAIDGVAGLVGVPSRLVPKLATQPYPIELRFTVGGFVPLTVRTDLGPQPGFPATFTAADLGRPALRRLPVELEVRSLELDAQDDPVPVAGGQVEITGLWRLVADVSPTAAPDAADIVSIGGAVAASRPVGTSIDLVNLNALPDPDRRLRADAAIGDRTLFVSNTGTLVPGDLVGINRADADRAEHIEVESIVGPSDPASPTQIRLRFPVKAWHRRDALVERVPAPAAAPADATLAATAEPGDVTVFVDTIAPFGPPAWVRIAGGSAAPEYATCCRYLTTTDGGGYARLAPLSRVAAVELTASSGALTGDTRFSPNYRLPTNRLHITLV